MIQKWNHFSSKLCEAMLTQSRETMKMEAYVVSSLNVKTLLFCSTSGSVSEDELLSQFDYYINPWLHYFCPCSLYILFPLWML